MIDQMKAQDLAEMTGKTYRRIKQIDDELPEDGKLLVKVERGYDAVLFVQRWVAYNVSKVRPVGDVDLEEEKALHEQLKREKTAIEIDRMKGELIPYAEVQRAFADLANTMAQRLLGLPSKMARRLIMMEDAEQIEAVIDKEIHDTMTMLADLPDIEGNDEMKDDGSGESG